MLSCPHCGGSVDAPQPLTVDLATNRLSCSGQSRRLAPKQAELLKILLRTPGACVRYTDIIAGLWGHAPPDGWDFAVRKHCRLLRGTLNGVGWTVRTEYGRGLTLGRL